MIDVDHFKNVNDQFGHVTGDRVLSVVGRVIRRRSKDVGFAGRYGGEEFVVLLQNTETQQAKEIAEGIRKGIEGIAIKERMIPVKVTVSIGLSSCETGECGHNVDRLLMAADRALYLAKNRGRNRVEG
jgi:diguanylate cyclase